MGRYTLCVGINAMGETLMADKYNFSSAYKHKRTYYIPILKMEIEGGLGFSIILVFSMLTGLLIFVVLFILLPLHFAGIGAALYVLVSTYFITHNLENIDTKTGKTPIELWWIKRTNTHVVYSKKNDLIQVKRKYKTKGVEIWTT